MGKSLETRIAIARAMTGFPSNTTVTTISINTRNTGIHFPRGRGVPHTDGQDDHLWDLGGQRMNASLSSTLVMQHLF